MNQILRCDWLSERARWRYLARSGLPAISRKEIVLFFHIINPLLPMLVGSRWLDIGLVLFFLFLAFMDLDSVSFHSSHVRKELGQYHAWSIIRIYQVLCISFNFRPES